MIQKLRFYFLELLSNLQAIAAGIEQQTARTVELTAAVRELSEKFDEVVAKLDGITVAIEYIQHSERTKNERSGLVIHKAA